MSSLDSHHKLIIALLCLSNIAITFNIGAVSAAIPLIGKDLGVSDFELAKIVSFYMIPYGIGALLYAPLSRFLKYRVILAGAMAAYVIFSVICALSQNLSTILLAQIGAGIAAASSTPLSLMIIGELFEKEMRGRLVGLYFGTSFFSSTVGMICMGILSWHWLFFIPAILGAMAFLGFVFIKNHLLDRTHTASINYFKALAKPEISLVFVYIFVMSCLYHSVVKWYGVYLAHDYSLNEKVISWILIVASVCGLSGQQIGGYLSDKKGRNISCYIGIFILSGATMLLIGHYSLILVTIVLGLISVGWTINHNAVSTILTDFDDNDRPVVASLNSSVRFFSGGLGFALSKVFVEKSFSFTFLGIGIIFFLMSGMIKFIMPQKS